MNKHNDSIFVFIQQIHLAIVAAFIFFSPTNIFARQAANTFDIFMFDLLESDRKNSIYLDYYMTPAANNNDICHAYDNFTATDSRATIQALLSSALSNLSNLDFNIENVKTLNGYPLSKKDMRRLEFIMGEINIYHNYGDISASLYRYVGPCLREEILSESECVDKLESIMEFSYKNNIGPKNDSFTSKFSISGEFEPKSLQVITLYSDAENKKGFVCDFDGEGLIVTTLRKPYIQFSSRLEFDFICFDLNNRKQSFSPIISNGQLASFRKILSMEILKGMSQLSQVPTPDPTKDIGVLDGGRTNKLTCPTEAQ